MESEAEDSCLLPPSTAVDDGDTFKILISSDNHLGVYDNSNSSTRENDSFNTFEEILAIAKREDVDFVLLGGDLFHENRPKPSTFQRAMDILQKYTLGEKPAQFEYLGDPATDFHGQSSPCVNYYNENINIGLPIFTIHGNHDDPVGIKKTSVIDHLAAANLLNHFGTCTDLNGFEIRPVLFRKGNTLLALYGLGAMKDQRLYRLMREGKVRFLRPDEDREKWFNIFVLHQNRVRHGATNFIPEKFIPSFIDLVIWGHEHECLPDPHPLTTAEGNRTLFIIQPGSSVVTQLQHGETIDKYTIQIQIHHRAFKSTKFKLQTVRPFVMADVLVSDILKDKPRHPTRAIEQYCESRIQALVREANDKLTGHPEQPLLPIVRLRVLHREEADLFNAVRFSQGWLGKIANEDVVLFKRLGVAKGELVEMEFGDMLGMLEEDGEESIDLGSHVEEIVERHFSIERERENGLFLQVLSEKGLSEAVRSAAEKDDVGAIKIVIEAQIQKTIEQLLKKKVDEETLEAELKSFRDTRILNAEQEVEEVRQALKGRKVGGKTKTAAPDVDMDSSIDDDYDDDTPAPGPSRGRGRGRGGARGVTRGGGGRGARGGAAAGAAGKKKMVQATLPVKVVTKGKSRPIQFDSDSD